MTNRTSKGSAFERWFSEQLSLWWTKGLRLEPRTDIFWRTSGSGGRASTRAKKKQRTSGQYGDVAAIDPIGQPLLSVMTIELKRGYNRKTIADLLDKPAGAAKQEYEEWIEKAEDSHKKAGSIGWAIVAKRDRREAIVLLPYSLAFDLNVELVGFNQRSHFHSKIILRFRSDYLFAMTLKDFFDFIPPDRFCRLAEQIHPIKSLPAIMDEKDIDYGSSLQTRNPGKTQETLPIGH